MAPTVCILGTSHPLQRGDAECWAAAAVALAARRVASFGTWVERRKTRALSGAFRRRNPTGSGFGGAVSGQRTEWPRRRPGRRSGAGRAGSGTARGPGWWGQAVADFVRKNSHSTDACRSVGAERNRGYQSGHPVRTLFRPCGRRRHCSRACPCRGRRFPLASGTSATPCGRLPLWSAGVLWIEAYRWVTCGLRRSPALLRPSPVQVSRGCWRFDAGRWITRGEL